MDTRGLLVRLEVVPGKDAEVEAFLQSAVPAVRAERGTTAWFALRFGRSEYGIFDVFPDDAARDAHLAGAVAAGLMQRAARSSRSRRRSSGSTSSPRSCRQPRRPGGHQGAAPDVQAKERPRSGRRAVSRERRERSSTRNRKPLPGSRFALPTATTASSTSSPIMADGSRT